MSNSNILYTLISRGNDTTLVEYYSATGNFPQIARNIIQKIQKNTKLSYSYDSRFIFHFINENNFTFMCLADAQFPKEGAYAFLNDIKEQFYNKFPPEIRNTAINFSLGNAFTDVIKDRMNYYNKNVENNKLTQIQQNLSEVKGIMVENIDKILDRGDQVQLLVKKTIQMGQQATTLKKQANQVRRNEQWKNIKFKLILGAIIVFVIYCLLAMICGGLNFPKCW